ncbi:MAG: hypothetical protein CMQ24_22665 [Gammaproteobacteria bacterium]|nr:hypothetical protein [Gammaproteobacteria bacterium]
MKKILKALAAVVVVAAGANVSAESVSGEISFSAVAGWLETGGVVHGVDWNDCTGPSDPECDPVNPGGNINGVVISSIGDISDVLGVGFGDLIEVYDFDLNGPLPTLEWLISTDDGSGLTGVLSFEITGGSEITNNGTTKAIGGTGMLDFACTSNCGTDNAGFDANLSSGWLITGSSSHLTAVIGSNVPEPTTMALFGAALIAWSFTRRRRAVEV